MSTIRTIYIPWEVGQPCKLYDCPNTLQAFQEAVDGYIESVMLWDQSTALINEEGKVDGMPANERATALVNLFEGDWIAGDMIVVGGVDDEGDFTGVSDTTIKFVELFMERIGAGKLIEGAP